MLSPRLVTCSLLVIAPLSVRPAEMWSNKEVLSGQLRVNGLALQVQSLRASENPERQLERLRASWGLCTPRCAIVRRGEWWLLDRIIGHWHETWQLRVAVDGGSEGYLSRADLAVPPRRPVSPPLSLPAHLQVQNSVEESQSAHPFCQWTLRDAAAQRDVRSLNLSLQRSAARAGWQWLKGSEDSRVLRWRRATQLLQGQWVEQGTQRWLLLILSKEG